MRLIAAKKIPGVTHNSRKHPVKVLIDTVNSPQTNIGTVRFVEDKSPPSLLDELADQGIGTVNLNPGRNSNGTAGWRLLGTKKVWRSDWTEYDNRQQRRASQQKTKDKAQKRKKANKHRGHNNSTNRKTNFIFSKTPSKHTRSKNERENMKNNTSQKWFNYNDSNMKRKSNGAVSNGLTSDKDLLAAAKLTFSKPTVKQRGIKFQRGEILNPYRL